MENQNTSQQSKRKKQFRSGTRRKVRVPRSAFPSTFTVFNMVCGYASMVMASDKMFDIAAWFIVLAAFFDAIDGVVARLTSSSSEFGVELDSLSDLVSFGAAPAFLVYMFGLSDYRIAGIGMSSLIMVAGGLRLARFNVQLAADMKKDVFSGLPTPAQAITIASFVIMMTHNFQDMLPYKNYFLIALTLVLSALMVSKIKYDVIPRPTLSEFKKHPTKISLYILAAILIAAFQIPAFFLVMMVYIIYGILNSLVSFFKRQKINEDNTSNQLYISDTNKP